MSESVEYKQMGSRKSLKAVQKAIDDRIKMMKPMIDQGFMPAPTENALNALATSIKKEVESTFPILPDDLDTVAEISQALAKGLSSDYVESQG